MLILTGPSHVGKSTAASALALRVPGAATVKFDTVLFDILAAQTDPAPQDFAIAYRVLESVAQELERAGRWPVVESTFTRVLGPGRGSALFTEELERLSKAASDARAPVVQLFASWEVVAARAARSGRLPEWIVRGTWEAHTEPWPGCIRLDTTHISPEETAERLRELVLC